MADQTLITHVQDMLKEETWTRQTISNYTKNNLMELADILKKAKTENCFDELQQMCDEHLSHSKDSIIALYLSGMISLEQGSLDTSALESLVEIFQKNHKEQIVIFLCEGILANDENNKFALRTLADCYRQENNEAMWPLYEKLVKLDFAEAELAKVLAEHYEEKGEIESAIDCYKKANTRFINTKNMNGVKETWSHLVQLIPEELDFFMSAKRKIAKTISEDKSALLLQELYLWYKNGKKWDTAISLLKQILEIDEKDSWARKELVECYKEKYNDRENVDSYIKASNLSQSFRNVHEAISDFEKHIAFDVKSYVFHRAWGVGRITKAEGDMRTINFGKKYGVREMQLKMAVAALTPLSPEHIWVLKATKKKAELAERVKKDKLWALKTIIKSFGNRLDLKHIKAELVPVILSPSEWTSWNVAAKKILSTDPSFDVDANDISMYSVREQKLTNDAKLANEFKAQKKFFERIDCFMKFVQNEETDKSSDTFEEMFSYFTNFLKTLSHVNEQVVAAFLTVQKTNELVPARNFQMKFSFADLYKKIPDSRAMYRDLKDTKTTTLRQDFIKNIATLPNWDEQFVYLFPVALQDSMLQLLIEKGKVDFAKKLAVSCFDAVKDNRNAVLYFFEKCQNAEWFKDANISYEKQLIALISIIDIAYREIANHIDTPENKKIIKKACTLLFKNDTLISYMLSNNEETIQKLYTLVADIRNLDAIYSTQLRNKILEKYPDFKFQVVEETSKSRQKGMLVTSKKLAEKKALLEEIQNVEIPKNAKEISEAREQGDLKENAEYKAAREHQHYLTVTLSKLQEEINRAVIFDPSTITTAYISFSTTAILHNVNTNADETYTIFGPWESDPEHNVISYMSPFGNALLDKKTGEDVQFTINDNNYHYIVKEIKAAK